MKGNCWRRRWRRPRDALDFERAAIYRDRLAALSAIQSQQGVNLRGVDDADVFAIHQAGGYNCVQVFFFRTGQNWGNRAYFPKADRGARRRRGAERLHRAILRRQALPAHDPGLGRTARARAARRSAVDQERPSASRSSRPKRGEKRDVIDHALANAREALGRKLAETSSQQALLKSLAELFGLPRAAAPDRGLRQQPHPGLECGRRHDRRRAGRLREEPVSQVQHPLRRSDAGRRFRHDARSAGAPLQAADQRTSATRRGRRRDRWPIRSPPAQPRVLRTRPTRPGPIWC